MNAQTVPIILLTLELHIPASGSLKEKRRVLKSLKDRIHHAFNVSVAETDYQDKWQRAILSVCAVGNDKKYLNGIMDRIVQLVQTIDQAQMTDYSIEFL